MMSRVAAVALSALFLSASAFRVSWQRNKGSTSSRKASPAAVGGKVVTLGDSYSSGTGIHPSHDDYEGGDCLRDWKTTPGARLARFDNKTGVNVACNGDEIPGILAQWEKLRADFPEDFASGWANSTILLTIGGNDLRTNGGQNWPGLLVSCIASFHGACHKEHKNQPANFDELQATLTRFYTKVAEEAPNARIRILGYPRLMQRKWLCLPVPTLNLDAADWVDRQADELNRRLAAAVAAVKSNHAQRVAAFRASPVALAQEASNAGSNGLEKLRQKAKAIAASSSSLDASLQRKGAPPAPTPAPARYTESEKNATACPAESRHMSARECLWAASRLGVRYERSGSWRDFPTGCFRDKQNWFFHNRHSGSPNGGANPVCRVQEAQYKESAKGAMDCPANSRKMFVSECGQAATDLGVEWGSEGQWDDFPGGCIRDRRNRIFYNDRHPGRAKDSTNVVCREEAQTPPPVLDMEFVDVKSYFSRGACRIWGKEVHALVFYGLSLSSSTFHPSQKGYNLYYDALGSSLGRSLPPLPSPPDVPDQESEQHVLNGWDKNKNGMLELDEALAIGEGAGPDAIEQLRTAFSEADTTKRGSLNLAGFQEFMANVEVFEEARES